MADAMDMFEEDRKFLKALIRIRLDMEDDFSLGRIKKSEIWDRVLEKVKDEMPNLKYTKDQISRKYLNLLTTYRRIKNRGLESGKTTTRWEYFDDFEEFFGPTYSISSHANYPPPSLDISEVLQYSADSRATDHSAESLEPLTDDPLQEFTSLPTNEDCESKYEVKRRKTFGENNISEHICSSREEHFERWARKKKQMLEIEFLEMRNYKMKLELLEKEQQMQLSLSKFTRNLIKN